MRRQSVSAVLRFGVFFGHGSPVEMLDPRLRSRRRFGELIFGAQIEVRLKISLNVLQLLHPEVFFEANGAAVEQSQHAWKRSQTTAELEEKD